MGIVVLVPIFMFVIIFFSIVSSAIKAQKENEAKTKIDKKKKESEDRDNKIYGNLPKEKTNERYNAGDFSDDYFEKEDSVNADECTHKKYGHTYEEAHEYARCESCGTVLEKDKKGNQSCPFCKPKNFQ